MSELALSALRPGDRGVIKHLHTATPGVRQRLLELGMTKGSLIELIRVAPMGDPLEVRIKGYRLSLRRAEAEAIMVRMEN